MRRSLLLLIVVLAMPVAAAWAAFGDPEVADPIFFVSDTIPDQLQVDGDGRAYFVSQEDVVIGDPDDGNTDRQVVVYERCGTTWQVNSRHGSDDDPAFSTRPIALEVAENGDMLVVWLDGDDDEKTIFTRFRPAGSDWEEVQEVETLPVSNVMTDIAPNGDAVIAYVEDTGTIGPVPVQVAVRTGSSGTWELDELGDVQALWAVAMSPASDAIVLTADRGASATTLNTWHRPAGDGWGTKQEAGEIQTTNSLRFAIAFGPDRKAVLGVGVPSLFGFFPPEVQTAVRSAGSSGTWSDLDQLSAVDNSAGGIVAIDAATHPGGVVLGWIERQNGAFLGDLVLSRFDGTGFETPKAYDVDDQFVSLSVGATPAGKAIVAAQNESPADVDRILVAEAQGIAGAWPDELDEATEPAGADFRNPRVGAGGVTAIAYGVHTSTGTQDRTEVVASGASPACGGTATATPTASATATATATATPQPPQPQPPVNPVDAVAPRGKLQKVAFKGGKVRITMRLNEPAAVTFKVDGKPLAKRTVKAGTRKLALKPKKKLKRGRHTLTAKAIDASDNAAKTLKKRFKVG